MKGNYYHYWAEGLDGLYTGYVHGLTETQAIEKVCKLQNVPAWAVTVQLDEIATQDNL